MGDFNYRSICITQLSFEKKLLKCLVYYDQRKLQSYIFKSSNIFCILTLKKNTIFKPIDLSSFWSKQCITPSAESPSAHWSVINKQLGVQRCNIEKK